MFAYETVDSTWKRMMIAVVAGTDLYQDSGLPSWEAQEECARSPLHGNPARMVGGETWFLDGDEAVRFYGSEQGGYAVLLLFKKSAAET